MERAGNPNLVEDLVSVRRRGERMLPTDLLDRLLPRDGIADDVRSVCAVVAVGAADVSHTLLASVLPLANQPPALARHAATAYDPATALLAGAPAGLRHDGRRRARECRPGTTPWRSHGTGLPALGRRR